MLTLFAASYIVCAITIFVGLRFFFCGGAQARAEDRSMVAAFLVSSAFYCLVHILAVFADAAVVMRDHHIGVLWAGFDFMVNVIHLAGVMAFSKCRLGRHTQETHR